MPPAAAEMAACMQTGDGPQGGAQSLLPPSKGVRQSGQATFACDRGFTYLALLLVLALGSALAAGWAQRASQAAQREREWELLYRGGQIAQAIARYRAADPAAPGPTDLASLLADRRGPQPRHHLRQLYPDPFTGRPDWVLLTDAQRRLVGVHSRATQRRLLQASGPEAEGPLLSDWVFRAQAVAPRSTEP